MRAEGNSKSGSRWVALRRVAVFFVCCLPLGTVLGTPKIEHWQTDNGARVYYVHAPELPIIDVRVVFDAGGARDNGRPGLAYLTNGLLGEGAGAMDADAIAEQFESLGAQFGTSSQRDMAVVELRSLSDPDLLQPALATLAVVLSQPSFADKALQRERERLLVALRHQMQSPAEVAGKAFYQGVYGEHPYASPPEGTEESLTGLTRDDIVRFYRHHYVARNAVIAIVGDVTQARARAIARQLTGGLAAGAAAPAAPAPAALAEARTRRIEHPATQTHIRVGQPGMRRGDPDYFPLYVGNHILGGSGLVSRLSQAVRERRGLSYSVYSYFLPMRVEGPLLIGLQTRNEQASEALAVLRETVEKFVAAGPTEDELTAAKQNITGSFALRIASNRKITENIAMIGFYRLPLDYLDTFTDRVNAVTLEQIRAAFARRVQPQRMFTVIVGGGADEVVAAVARPHE